MTTSTVTKIYSIAAVTFTGTAVSPFQRPILFLTSPAPIFWTPPHRQPIFYTKSDNPQYRKPGVRISAGNSAPPPLSSVHKFRRRQRSVSPGNSARYGLTAAVSAVLCRLWRRWSGYSRARRRARRIHWWPC